VSVNMKVKIKIRGHEEEISGSDLAQAFIPENKLKSDQDLLLQNLDDLSTYTSVVDPDTVAK